MLSRLEPFGLHRSDGKGADGRTVVSWRSEKLLIWDVTCQDTFAPSYFARVRAEVGAVAALAEQRKVHVAKYIHLAPGHLFSQLTVETMGVFGHAPRHSSKNWADPGHRGEGSNHIPHPETVGGSAAGQLMTKL